MSLLWISAFVQGQVLDFEHDLSFRKKNHKATSPVEKKTFPRKFTRSSPTGNAAGMAARSHPRGLYGSVGSGGGYARARRLHHCSTDAWPRLLRRQQGPGRAPVCRGRLPPRAHARRGLGKHSRAGSARATRDMRQRHSPCLFSAGASRLPPCAAARKIDVGLG